MKMSAEQILLALHSKLERDGYGWWFPEKGFGEEDIPPSFEQFWTRLEEICKDEI